MLCSGTSKGSSATAANFSQSSGRAASEGTGCIYISRGIASCKSVDKKTSMTSAAASGCSVPVKMPAYSTCRKQVSSIDPVGASTAPSGTSDGGEDA